MQTRFGPCPRASEVCPFKGCPVNGNKLCSANGNCYDGKCYCAVDAAGVDCAQGLCDTNADCKDGQFCTDLGECTWGTAPPPPPPVPPGGVLLVRLSPAWF